MRHDKHCCYQNDRNTVLIPFCLQLLTWSLWASQINPGIPPGTLPAPKEIPSKAVEKTFSRLFPNLWTPAPENASGPAWKRWLLYFPQLLSVRWNLNQILTQLMHTSWTAVQQMQPPPFAACQICSFTVQSHFTWHLSSFWDPSQFTPMFSLLWLFGLPVSFTAPRFQLT